MCFISSSEQQQPNASSVSFIGTILSKYPYILGMPYKCLVLGVEKPVACFLLSFFHVSCSFFCHWKILFWKSLQAYFPEPLESLVCFQVSSVFEMAPHLPHQQTRAYYITVGELLLPVCHFKSSMQDLTGIPRIPGFLPLSLECQTSLWELCRL